MGLEASRGQRCEVGVRLDPDDDPQTWLRYYATDAQREEWAAETGEPLPSAESPPYPRKMPTRGF